MTRPLDWQANVRLVMLLGLAAHKLVWEVLKRRDPPALDRERATQAPFRRGIKVTKVAALIGLVAQLLLPQAVLPIARRPRALRVAGLTIYGVGLGIALLGRLQLGRNWADLEDARLRQDQSLVETGMYGFIRHPIYTGDLLLLTGLELALNSWLVLGLALPVAVIVDRAAAEEALLAGSLPGYAAYRGRTWRFVPYIF
jgi:protein-S-isoprenylcysteine O-methyltransferase Ste14